MKKVLVVAPADAQGGFAIAGVAQRNGTRAQLPQLLHAACAAEDVGVIAVDERLIDPPIEEDIRELERNWRGVIVVVPPPGGAAGRDDYARRLIRRAIGYQVRVQL
jgi:vacuolar-type H+-ATPase subunit F/Vma7